ncbi:DUF4892 domain-containing protein [Halioglobus maricola]|nr:DUF4892 domain-containing protein [Halioglobus maricola]
MFSAANSVVVAVVTGVLLATNTAVAQAESPLEILQGLDVSPHMQQVSFDTASVIDHEVGLGAMKKVRGSWQFKASERLTGELTRYSWQVRDGFTSNEVLEGIEAGLNPEALLFSCDGRSCGQGVQWANRVFRERVLYGRDDLQRYRVYGPMAGEAGADSDYRLILFSSARTADRQYLHAEVLEVMPVVDAP